MVNVQELEEQEKEKNQVRSELVHSAENAAIREGLQSHDASLGGEVIKQVFGNILKQPCRPLLCVNVKTICISVSRVLEEAINDK